MKLILKNSTIGVCKYTGLTMLSSTNKKQINSSGVIIDTARQSFVMYNVDVYEVSEGDVIKIIGSGYYNNDQAVYALYNGEPDSTTLQDIYIPISSRAYTNANVDVTITIPSGVIRLGITRYSHTIMQPASLDIYPLKVN